MERKKMESECKGMAMYVLLKSSNNSRVRMHIVMYTMYGDAAVDSVDQARDQGPREHEQHTPEHASFF